nr:unnamed protein product [Callosobruchus chinensis]
MYRCYRYKKKSSNQQQRSDEIS